MNHNPDKEFDLDKILDRTQWKPDHTMFNYKQRQLWFPLSTALDYWDDEFHALLLHDYIRMEGFTAAIRVGMSALAERARAGNLIRIIDIGTGTGIWAYCCWKFLQEHSIPDDRVRIYALEARTRTFDNLTTPYLVSRNIPSIFACNVASGDFIDYVNYNSKSFRRFDAELTKACTTGATQVFDCIVCECIGGLGDDEGMTEIMRHAVPRLLKKDGLIIPTSMDIFAAPVAELPADRGSIHAQLQTFLNAKRLEKIHTISSTYRPDHLAASTPTPMLDVVIPRSLHAADAHKLHSLDFSRPESLESNYTLHASFSIAASIKDRAKVTGLKVWFSATLLSLPGKEPIVLDISGEEVQGVNDRASDCWKHTFLPLEEPVPVKSGDVLEVELSRELARPPEGESAGLGPTIKYSWSARLAAMRTKMYFGQLDFRHDVLADNSRRYRTERFGLFDIYRNFGLLSDIILTLCVTVLFGFALGAHGNEHGTAPVFSMMDRVLIFGTALLLIRIVHSFVLLVADNEFSRTEYNEFMKLGRRWQVIRIIDRTLLALCTLAFVWIINNATLFVKSGSAIVSVAISFVPFVIFALLYRWDSAALHILDARVRQTKEGTRWSMIGRQAVHTWVRLESWCGLICIITLPAFLLLDQLWHDVNDPSSIGWTRIMEGFRWVAAGLLYGSFFYDYYANREFYSGRLKEGAERSIPKLF